MTQQFLTAFQENFTHQIPFVENSLSEVADELTRELTDFTLTIR